MMNIKDAKINWCKGYGNFPTLEVTVDNLPSIDELVYERVQFEKTHALYFAQLGDYVSFFAHNFKNETGFGGHTFTLKLKSGETIKIKGPWSSNSSFMNDMGFPRSLEVIFKIESEGYKLAGAMLESKALELINAAGACYTFIHEYDESKESSERTEFFNNVVIKFGGMTIRESQLHKNRICSCDERPVEYCPIHGISAQLNRSQME